MSQVLTSQFGEILRLNPDGTNPTDNPFSNGNPRSVHGSIWALGLRNPYTFAFQPGSALMYINDVGEGTWEEIDRGEVQANYGWAGSTSPVWEGFESPPPPWANHRDPVMAYDHSSASGAPAGCAITGGAFYPTSSQFGSASAGKYFFADFCGDFIRLFDPASPGSVSNPDTSAAFASSLTFGNPVDLKLDAAGSLYFLTRGSGGGVFKIQFQAPAITSQPASTTVTAGQTATCSVSATASGALSYQWEKLNGNSWTNLINGAQISGATSATLTLMNTQASDGGTYRVVVRNANGATAASNRANLTVNAVVSSEQHFDFGTTTSPVATGYTQVTPTTTYMTAQGYGWQSGTILAVDRGTGTDLTRDLNYGTSGTFAVDLANGTYTGTLTVGDLGHLHDQVQLSLEGVVVDTLSTAGSQVLTKSYTVTVSDGQLTLRLQDLGGIDPNCVLMGLDVA